MNDYIIFADSSCDLTREMLDSRGVRYCSLTFRFDGEDEEYTNDGMNITDFYNKMREGGVAKTSAVNSETFAQAFEREFKDGHDILYIGFSTGLSTTCNSARIASEQLRAAYPDRRVIIVDTLAASCGIALLIDMILEKKNAGATIDEAAAFAENNKMRICHWFTVDDLVYLKRGGRISPTAAFFGNMIGIKPVLHVDNDGHLVNVLKVRGRRTSVMTLAEKYGELADDEGAKRVYISHSDCLDDAQMLGKMINDKYGAKTELITDVGPVIGAHSGPGTLALFFVGKER